MQTGHKTRLKLSPFVHNLLQWAIHSRFCSYCNPHRSHKKRHPPIASYTGKDIRNLKESFKEDALLRHYDVNVPTFVFVDTHNTVLSAVLTQGALIYATAAVALPFWTTSRATAAAEKTARNWIKKQL